MKKVLIIGLGGMGIRHIKAFHEISNVQVFCFDVDVSCLKDAEVNRQPIKCCYDLDKVPVPEMDGVVIASPTHTHLRYMEWCVQNSLDFMVEKPISLNMDGLQGIVEEVKRKGLTAGVAYPRRNSAAVNNICKMVAEGFIGDLKAINSVFSQDFRKYRPDYQKIYYAKLSTGGGLIMDALSHHIDMLTYFAGQVEQVAAISDTVAFEGCEGEDTAVILLRFKNGIIGNINGNQFQKPNVDQVELIGTSGNLKYDRLTGVFSWNRSDSVTWETEKIDGNWDSIIRNQAENFLKALSLKNAKMMTSLEEGIHTLKVVLAARESNHSKQFVHLI